MLSRELRRDWNMDWSRIKTIFIVTFLILNMYLLNEFYKIYESSKYDYMYETSFENKLKTEEIEYVELPKNIKKDNFISATPKKFAEDELEKMLDTLFKGQAVTMKNETTLESVLEKPIKVSENPSPEELAPFLKNSVLEGDQYRFWSVNPNEKTVTYYQQLQGKVLFKNISGELTLYMNDNHEIVAYKQTLLEDFEVYSEEENILQPLKAIETLYENGELTFGDKITKVELGYYTLVHLTSSQLLTPVWRFVVNGERDLFVNAVEGQIIKLNNEEKKIVE